MKNITELTGRILLGSIFILSGIGKIGAYGGTQAYMNAVGIPGALAPFAIAFEIIAPVLLIVGWQTRYAALALAGFSVLTALIFHFDFGDQMQSINFMKNIAMAGGFLILAVHGAGAFSLDARRSAKA